MNGRTAINRLKVYSKLKSAPISRNISYKKSPAKYISEEHICIKLTFDFLTTKPKPAHFLP